MYVSWYVFAVVDGQDQGAEAGVRHSRGKILGGL